MNELNDPRGSPSNLPALGRVAWSLLQWVIPEGFPHRKELLGDLLERLVTEILLERGPWGASWWLWSQVIRNIPPAARWRLQKAFERLESSDHVVRVVHLALLVYLLPAILLTMLLMVVAIAICHVLDLGQRGGRPGGKGGKGWSSLTKELWDEEEDGPIDHRFSCRRGGNQAGWGYHPLQP
jgi:hypothetical protein